jgi:hypothetical protein
MARRLFALVTQLSLPFLGVMAGGPATALARLPSCPGFGTENVVGGNNSQAGNPGNVSSPSWVRMYGNRATFQVPPTPILRTDCLGAVGGILLKVRAVNPDNSLSNTFAATGVLYDYGVHAGQSGNTIELWWGSGFYTSSPSDIEQGWHRIDPQSIAAIDCQLLPGNTVTLQIKDGTDTQGNHIWEPQCYDGSGWLPMNTNVAGYVDNAHNFGVDLFDRFRAGNVGGLGLDVTALKEQTVTGSWQSWENTDCFSNSTTTGGTGQYKFNSISSSEFTITHEAANPNC